MILVTGATGIVGHFVALTLVTTGHKIRALKRADSNTKRLDRWQNSIEWVDSDLLDLLSLEKAFKGIDRVIHCAAKVSFHQEDKAEMIEVNVIGTANMVNLSLAYGIEKFIHVSSVAAFGRKSEIEEIDENIKWEASENNSNYAESKYLGELEGLRAQEEGLDSVIVNPSIVLGPGDWNSSSMQLFKYVKEERYFYPKGEMNYVDVRDVANIIEVLLFSDICKEKYILNSGKAYYKDVFQLIASNMKKRPPKIEVSYALLTFAYVMDSIKSRLLGIKSIITKESIRMSKMSFFYSNKKIISTLNYKFKTLEESITWTCEEIDNQGF
jgi:nucleoside-diphosphate-sugar epimerase